MRNFIIFIIFITLFSNNNAIAHDKEENIQISFLHKFYSKFISRVDGDRCPMLPSCSNYSKESFKKNGLIIGFIMTCDRLLRCGRDEIKFSDKILIESEGQKSLRFYDPVKNNDFWWK